MKKQTIIGMQHGTSKKGNEYLMLTLSSPASKEDNEKERFGQIVETVFVPNELIHNLSPKDIGRDINCIYEVNFGRAYLVDIAFISKEK